MDTIYFMSYGIYSYTEMAGSKFSNYEDLESINKKQNIKLPKRIKFLIENDKIQFPHFYTDEKTVEWEKGATYLGVKKTGNKYEVISVPGDQGI